MKEIKQKTLGHFCALFPLQSWLRVQKDCRGHTNAAELEWNARAIWRRASGQLGHALQKKSNEMRAYLWHQPKPNEGYTGCYEKSMNIKIYRII